MSVLVVTMIALGTLAFGAVYPWAFVPLFAASAAIGIVGLRRGGVRHDMRLLAAGVLLLWVASAMQLLPVSRLTLEALSPHTAAILSRYSLMFAGGSGAWVPLSIDPRETRIAVLALGALGVYLLGLPALLGTRGLRLLPERLAIFAVPLALFGIFSRMHHPRSVIYGFWRPYAGGGDQAGPFVNRNHFAGWMLMTVCLLIGWLFGQVEGASRHVRGKRQSWLEWLSSAEANRILLTAAAVFVAAISLIWTLSRSALIGLGIGSVAFVWLVMRRDRLGRTRRHVVLVSLGAALLMGVMRRGPTYLVEWFSDTLDLFGRLDAWRDGWQVVRDFPIFGTGLNTYPTAMLFYQTRNPGLYVAQAHNDYLQLLAEGGLLVTIPAALSVVMLARAIRRNLRAARNESRGYWIRAGAAVGLVAIGAQELFEFSLQIPVNALLFCTLAAIALAPVHEASNGVARSRHTIDISGGSSSG